MFTKMNKTRMTRLSETTRCRLKTSVECIIKAQNPSLKNINMSYDFLVKELIDFLEDEANKYGYERHKRTGKKAKRR